MAEVVAVVRILVVPARAVSAAWCGIQVRKHSRQAVLLPFQHSRRYKLNVGVAVAEAEAMGVAQMVETALLQRSRRYRQAVEAVEEMGSMPRLLLAAAGEQPRNRELFPVFKCGSVNTMRTGILVLTMLAVSAIVYMRPTPLVFAFEDLSLMIAPSAERAVVYGNWHFNATNGRMYDIERAEHLYRAAEELDANQRGVHHQLARIDFLRAKFPSAIERIDKEIALYGEENPNAYYIRALVLGYQGKYLDAAADYEKYFTLAPANWAAINDYSWVLLKAKLPEGALSALEWGLAEWPENPWLLHNKVIALYEVGRYEEAATAAAAAAAAVDTVTEADWLIAYPGNDPRSAGQGLASFKAAVRANQEKVQKALEAGE